MTLHHKKSPASPVLLCVFPDIFASSAQDSVMKSRRTHSMSLPLIFLMAPAADLLMKAGFTLSSAATRPQLTSVFFLGPALTDASGNLRLEVCAPVCAESAAAATRRPDVTLHGFHDNGVRKNASGFDKLRAVGKNLRRTFALNKATNIPVAR